MNAVQILDSAHKITDIRLSNMPQCRKMVWVLAGEGGGGGAFKCLWQNFYFIKKIMVYIHF